MDLSIDIRSLSMEELQEEFLRLKESNSQFSELKERDAQTIYELRRHLATSKAAEAHLSQELEQLATIPANSCNNSAHNKLEHELEDIRCRYKQLADDNASCQQNNEDLHEQNANLCKELEEVKRAGMAASSVPAKLQHQEREQELQNQVLELIDQLEQLGKKSMHSTMSLAEREKNLVILREELDCMNENLQHKRHEVEELKQLLESEQEQLMEANNKIRLLTAEPEQATRKGNSLFAEVDDQRQAMKQIMAAQKKNYIQMKKAFNESEHEIRRLKRENIAMHAELQACSSIFYSADKTFQDKLRDRLKQIYAENGELEQKLQWTQDRLKELAKNQNVDWLEPMLNYCRQETVELKQQLHWVRLHNATLEEQLRDAQKDMARWRFEALKLKCLLLHREDILLQNKISFEQNPTLKYGSVEQEKLLDSFKKNHVESVKKEPLVNNEKVVTNDEQTNAESSEENDLALCLKSELPEMNDEKNKENTTEEKENNIADIPDVLQVETEIAPKLELEAAKPLASILNVRRNVFEKDWSKSVKFAATPIKPSSTKSHEPEEKKLPLKQEQTSLSKPNVIVRRIAVGSHTNRHDNKTDMKYN